MAEDQILNPKLKLRLFLAQILIACAMILGVSRALSRRAKADLAEQKVRAAFSDNTMGASDDSLFGDIERAAELDPQDWQKAMLYGDILVRNGRDGTKCFLKALALDPTQPEPLARLLAPLIARQDWPQALEIAETAARNAPQVRDHWQTLANVAASAGRTGMATAYAQRALSLAIDQPAAHAQVEDLHRKVGNMAAASHRRAAADRLQADLDTRTAR